MATNGLEIKVGADVGGAVNGINQLNKSLKTLPNSSGQATQALTNFGRVVQDAPFGIIGVANNIDPLIQSFTALKASTGSTGQAFKLLASSLIGPAGLALAVSTITSLLVVFAKNNQGAKKAVDGTADAIRNYKEISNDAVAATAGQAETIKVLGAAIANTSNSYTVRNNALKELQKINKSYFGDLSLEKSSYEEITAAVNEYSKSIYRAATIKGLQDEIAQATKEQRALLKEQREAGTNFINARDAFQKANAKEIGKAPVGITATNTALINLSTQYDVAKQRISNVTSRIRENSSVLRELKNALNVTTLEELKFGKATNDISNSIKGNNKEIKQSTDDLLLGYVDINGALVKNIELIIRQKEEQARFNAEVLKNAPKNKPGSQLAERLQGNATGGGEIGLDQLQGVDTLNKKLFDTKELITNGLNGGIDTFFNALANNQDPFKALAQSVQRLVVELGAAVVKMLIIKAISTAISGGTSNIGGLVGAFGGGGGGGLSSILRSDQLRLLSFGR